MSKSPVRTVRTVRPVLRLAVLSAIAVFSLIAVLFGTGTGAGVGAGAWVSAARPGLSDAPAAQALASEGPVPAEAARADVATAGAGLAEEPSPWRAGGATPPGISAGQAADRRSEFLGQRPSSAEQVRPIPPASDFTA